MFQLILCRQTDRVNPIMPWLSKETSGKAEQPELQSRDTDTGLGAG